MERRRPAQRFSFLFNGFLRLSLLLGCLLLLAPARGVEIWVATNGSPLAAGTRAQPLVSPGEALRRAAEWRRQGKISAGEPIKIFLRGGIYPLSAPVELRSESFGTEQAPLTIEAVPGERAVLSGGVEIRGWEKLTNAPRDLPKVARAHVWVAPAPRVNGKILQFRQLWVNDRKAVRAREPNDGKFFRLAAWDRANQTAAIPEDALRCPWWRDNAALPEMVLVQVWEIADLRVKKIRFQGARAFVSFRQPESAIEFQHPWPPVIVNSNYQAPFFLVNAMEFLDSPGEWFEDLRAGKIYYWPRTDEDLTRAQVIAPALETLLKISGSPDKPAANIAFQGITFAHTTWLRPSRKGHVPLQAGMFLLAAHKLSPRGTAYHPGLDNVAWIGRPPAAVSVKNADHISFERCLFEHTASAGLDFESGAHDDRVEGCLFRDLGGNGIQIGTFSNPQVETHVPWNPAEEGEICARETIANNCISNCGAEDWGCVGIAVGYAREIRIAHNDVSDLPYSGISVGWGWTRMTNALRDNFIFANRVHRVGRKLGDLGGIYLLSAQPGTLVAENSVFDIKPSALVPDPQHWFYLYADEGSAWEIWRDNWCPAEKFLRNANGPGNIWTNNGPMVSETIKNAAGLEPAFRDLLERNLAGTLQLNTDH